MKLINITFLLTIRIPLRRGLSKMRKTVLIMKSIIVLGFLTFQILTLVAIVPAEGDSLAQVGILGEKNNLNNQNNDSSLTILDPTGITAGYKVEENSTEIFELRGSRSQTAQHFYNPQTKRYTYRSAQLVQKTGVYEDTVWVTAGEYPTNFFLRLQNDELLFFENTIEIETYLSTIDKTTINMMGVESYSGAMGFAVNLEDNTAGHGQYLYWPRLRDGTITAYDMPLYTIFPHLFLQSGFLETEQILTDQALLEDPIYGSQDIRENLEVFMTSTEFGVYYTASSITIHDSTWDVRHGFKYRLDDQRFHMITELKCLDSDFTDVGLTYDITSTVQSENTLFAPMEYILSNETSSTQVSAQIDWTAEQLVLNYSSSVRFVAENNEQFQFAFDDMELAGFTTKELGVQNLQLPDGRVENVLCAGMANYGAYSAGTAVIIDPNISVQPTDNYDLMYENDTAWITSYTFADIGHYYFNRGQTVEWERKSFVAWDTNISMAIEDISIVSCQLYIDYEQVESGEGVTATVYNVGGNANSNTTKEDSEGYELGTNENETGVLNNPGSGSYKTLDTTKMEILLDFWANNRDNDEGFVSFRFKGWNTDAGTNDRIRFFDSQYGSNEPKLNFTYNPSTVEISGYITDNTASNAIDEAGIELYLGSECINASTSNSSGYYAFTLNESTLVHNLWVWHTDYERQNLTFSPSTNQTLNFSLVPLIVPTQSEPYGCNSPTDFTDPDTSWTNESYAYALGTDYAIGETTNKSVYYTDFDWNVSSLVTIQGVYVYIHWRPSFDDQLHVTLHWNAASSNSSSQTLTASNWTLSYVNFTSATTWTTTKINSPYFKVEIKKYTSSSGYEDGLLVDWVGTTVEIDWTSWMYPATINDNGWVDEDNISADDGHLATCSSVGLGYYIEGASFPYNESGDRYIHSLQVAVEVKHNGPFWVANPQIQISAYYDAEWHEYGSFTVNDVWETKVQSFLTFIDPPNDIKVRVYISSNTDSQEVQIDYVKCRMVGFIKADLDFSELGDPETSHPNATGSTSSLGSDWGRHPNNETVIIEANCIVYEAYGSNVTAAEAAYALWDYVHSHWNYENNMTIYNDIYTITHLEDGNYTGACYASAILLSGLARAIKIPTRIILLDFKASFSEHLFVEFYLNDTEHNGWVTADGTFDVPDGYGWYDWDDLIDGWAQSCHWNTSYDPIFGPDADLERIRWVYEVLNETKPLKWIGYSAISKEFSDDPDSDWTTWDDYQIVFNWES